MGDKMRSKMFQTQGHCVDCGKLTGDDEKPIRCFDCKIKLRDSAKVDTKVYKSNNPKGTNQHSSRTEIVKKPIDILEKMTKEELVEERTRLVHEQIYYRTFVYRYGQRISQINEKLGEKNQYQEIIKKANTDFEKKVYRVIV